MSLENGAIFTGLKTQLQQPRSMKEETHTSSHSNTAQMASRHEKPSLEYQFATSTTCHGAAKIAEAQHRPVRFIWVLVFTAAWGLCTWQCADRIWEYFQYRTTTEISRVFEPELDFPAVTICSFNRIRSSQVNDNDLTTLWAVYALGLSGVIEDEWTQGLLSEYFDFLTTDWDNFNVSKEILDFGNFTRRAGFVLNNLTLLECHWRGQDCFPEDFRHVFTSYGNCWTFNADENGALKQTVPGAGNGLRIVIDIEKHENTEHPIIGNSDDGLKFHVHHPSVPVSMDTDGLAVPPGMHAFASVQQIRNENKRWPWGQCFPERENLHFYSTYSLEGCLMECKANYVLRHCNCRPTNFPGKKNTPYCGPWNLSQCVFPTLAALNDVSLMTECGCSVPCNYNEYPVTTTYAGFPNDGTSTYFEDLINASSGYFKENLVALDVFYKDMSYLKLEQHQAVTKSGLISDIGGQLGFFVGCSVITVAELAEYLTRKFRLLWKNKRRRRQNKKRNKQSSFGIRENPTLVKSSGPCAEGIGNNGSVLAGKGQENANASAGTKV